MRPTFLPAPLLIYAKGRHDTLSYEQTVQLRALVRKEFK